MQPQAPSFAEHLLWLDTLVFSNELADIATPDHPVDSFDLLTPVQRTALAAGLYLACFGPSPLPARRRLQVIRDEGLEIISDLESLREAMPDHKVARSASYSRAFSTLLAVCATAAVHPSDTVAKPPVSLAPAFRDFQSAVIDDRATGSSDGEDLRALVSLAAVASTADYATGHTLRAPLLELTSTTLLAAATDADLAQPELLTLTWESLGAKPVDYLPASVMALAPAVGPYVEDLFSLALISATVYSLQLALATPDVTQEGLDQAYADLSAALQRWSETLYASRRVAVNGE